MTTLARLEQGSDTAYLPLENGDCMTREEFHRIYELRTDLEHVQLIEGMVYMPSPIRLTQHGEPQAIATTWLGTFAATRPDVIVAGPSTVLLDDRNEPEPDAMLMRRALDDGSTTITAEGYVSGAPELVVEISATSATIDLGPKLRAYRRNGVQEYIVWLTHENRLLWHRLANGDYSVVEPDESGMIHSLVFPGLRLHVPSLFARDLGGVLRAQADA